MKTVYELKLFDRPLLRFSADAASSDPDITILWMDSEHENLLPMDLKPTAEGLWSWLRHRSIPGNRAFVQNFLSKCGLSLNRPMSVIAISKGLSLNDCYWITEQGFEGTFEKYNLFHNRFSNILGVIAFTGYGSYVRSGFTSSPEFTTNGMLPKCWRRMSGHIKLYKGGTSGASNTGNEPYSEFYAYQVAQVMGINAIPYGLSRWKGVLCSTCELFTDIDHSYMPVGRLVTHGGMKAVRAFYGKLGQEFTDALDDMLVLDALICNTDRHYGNFGFIIDSRKNTIAAPAPLFDHGNSLFNFAAADDLKNEQTFQRYVDTLQPCVYDDFLGTAAEVISQRHKAGLRRLAGFHFRKHSRYNLPAQRLSQIECQIQKRAGELLERT